MQLQTLAANQTWFNFAVEGAVPGIGAPSVYSFSGTESVSKPYEFSIELVSRNSSLDITSFLGMQALLSVADRSKGTRLVHGVIRQMEQLHTANAFTHYSCILTPRLWFLSQTQDHKIYQHKTVVQIIEKILQKHKFVAEAYSFKLRETYQEREYCVQYSESDLHFLSRLCEEEGIYFYFEHTPTGHCVCFSDAEGGPPIIGESSLRFYPGSGNPADTAVISRLNLRHRINSDIATFRDWNFITPATDLKEMKNEADWVKAPVPLAMELETYQYPHIYQDKEEGKRYAQIQLQRQLTFREWVECESDVARLTPGFTFVLHSHPRLDANRAWWIASVTHSGEQPQVLEHEAPDERGMRYNATVTAIPASTRFVPEAEHKKIRIEGVQSAIVTGPKCEEIYVDEHGRVKVQFFWDRSDQWNENTTCWIRASQGWAGGQYGSMAIPRIGHEVLVAFQNGDPDRPLIIGRAYHEQNKPPYPLPEHKTRTVFKSMSTPGKEGEQRGFNELRIEDKKGQEEIYVHAEKNAHLYVKNDWKEHVLNDRHQIVDHFTYLETKGETHEKLHEQRKSEMFANDNLTIHGTSHISVDEKWLLKTGDEVHIKAGMKVVLEAGAELTIKAGGQWLRLDPSGIRTSSVLNIGSGPAGEGTGAEPEKPKEAAGTEAGKRVKADAFNFNPEVLKAMKDAMQNAQNTAQPVAEQCSL